MRKTAQAIWSAATWNYAEATGAGAYVYIVYVFMVAVALSTVQMDLDSRAYLWRLIWVGGSTGWALRMVHLAGKESDGRLGRRGGVLISTTMVVGVLTAGIGS